MNAANDAPVSGAMEIDVTQHIDPSVLSHLYDFRFDNITLVLTSDNRLIFYLEYEEDPIQ